jgi:deoxycytidylate deaminase
MLINARIEKIYYKEGYADNLSSLLLAEAQVPVVQLG